MSKIKVIEKNEGTKIEYEVTGNKICFDDDLTINLAKREKDSAVHIDICHDMDGQLVIGVAAGRTYVAELDIPARAYEEVEGPDAPSMSMNEDEDDMPHIKRVPLPFDVKKVTLSLWAI